MAHLMSEGTFEIVEVQKCVSIATTGKIELLTGTLYVVIELSYCLTIFSG